MARIIIHKFSALTPEELAALVALLAAAGLECDPDVDIGSLEDLLAAAVDDEENENGDDPADWILVVILSPECDADGALTQAADKISRAGGRVIGIWPRDGGEGRVPPAVERYGADTIPWDIERVRGAAAGETVSWATPTGAPRAEPVTRRHKC